MELNGALSNPFKPSPTSLYRLLEVQRAVLTRPPVRRRRVVAARPAPIIETILFVLSRACRPMGAREVHAAAEEWLGHDVNWSSVRNALSDNARRQDGLVRRIGHGVYEVRADVWERQMDGARTLT
ncbi:MAG: hypothetical protein ACXWC3_19020 [Burkholderiales bacterium]